MAGKTWARIEIERTIDHYYRISIRSDMLPRRFAGPRLDGRLEVVCDRNLALRRARMWSRRLGGIEVKMVKETPNA